MTVRRRNKIRDFTLTLLFFGIIAFSSAWLAKQNEVSLQGKYKIIDGDSLMVSGREIRLLGIDAPEYRQSCTLENEQTYPCGKQSRSYLSKLVKTGKLDCIGWEEDKYQRLLAVCSAGELELNARMVRDGWAIAYGDYENEEHIAKNNKAGVWQGGFESPSSWRENMKEAHAIGWLSKYSFW